MISFTTLLLLLASTTQTLAFLSFRTFIPSTSFSLDAPSKACYMSTSTSIPTSTTEYSNQNLPFLFPELAIALSSMGFITPTPIQAAIANANADDNLLLIAPTGSGKTLAYLIKALTRAMTTDGTILMVAPTRELALQLAKDATLLLSALAEGVDATDAVVLAVAGMPFDGQRLDEATILVGTPTELIQVLSNGAGEFIAGDTLCAIVLDEVDVLLPLPLKQLRTSLDTTNKGGDTKNKSSFDSAQEERRKMEQKRKLLTAKRQGAETSSNNQLIAPTEKLLTLIASNRFVGTDSSPPLVLAGSATASRRTLDRLNQALRTAAERGGAATMDKVWAGVVKAVRPEENDTTISEGESSLTIRAVSVPTQVQHSYISLTKEEASSSTAVLTAVAKAAALLKPETALVFICGEFAKTVVKEKTVVAKPINGKPGGKPSKPRRDVPKKTSTTTTMEPLSARRACLMLNQLGLEAQPLHVAMGLEQDPKHSTTSESSVLVTFEGSARGLHLNNVDTVFVVGRPASAASYLHLAGRVGRAGPSENGGIVIRPGTVVSLCTKGSATELGKWTKQVGGTELQELVIV